MADEKHMYFAHIVARHLLCCPLRCTGFVVWLGSYCYLPMPAQCSLICISFQSQGESVPGSLKRAAATATLW